ncbi:MAG: ATP-binding protein [Chitinophagaceae bacterium]|nr:ATP-binding protein [Chitinophagaceae bacterium]
MPDNLYHSNFNFYQNANAEASEIKENFLIRQIEYSIIIEDIKRHHGDSSTQHYLLVGRRGSGKSTLLKRLQVELETDARLRQLYIAINPAEEQANMYRLYDLLEEVIRELEHNDINVGEYEFHEDTHAFTRQLFSMIHAAVERSGKRLVLLLDNMDRIFDNIGEDAHLLREDLLNYSGDIKIIGASTRVTEHFWRYDKPFYEFFRIFKLEPLTSEEMKTLLLNWSKRLNLPQIEEFVQNKPGQLETIRILTDGLPRTLQFFVNILLTRDPETGYEYLRLIMDSMTPLYQERLNSLPPAQRKIVLQMAFIWEAAGAGDIAAVTRMENNLVSAQLKQLAGKGIVEKLDTGGRNHLYRLAERFFNLWLIFTQGSPGEKRKAKYLTIFLENFYDAEEIQKLAVEHLKEIEEGKIEPNKAAVLTKAYAHSKYISSAVREMLIEKTLLLPGVLEEMRKQLPPMVKDILKDVNDLTDERAWKKAFSSIETIEQNDGVKDLLKAFVYFKMGDCEKAEPFFLAAIDKGIKGCLTTIAWMYLSESKFDLAEGYVLKALAEGEKESIQLQYFVLSGAYYGQNKAKPQTVDIIKELAKVDPSEHVQSFLPVVKAWNGEFSELERDIEHLLESRNPFISRTLIELLAHYQANLVHKFFLQEKFGKQLTEELLPLYYATQELVDHDPKKSLIMPPELQQPVNDLLNRIKESQQFYYGKVRT